MYSMCCLMGALIHTVMSVYCSNTFAGILRFFSIVQGFSFTHPYREDGTAQHTCIKYRQFTDVTMYFPLKINFIIIFSIPNGLVMHDLWTLH